MKSFLYMNFMEAQGRNNLVQSSDEYNVTFYLNGKKVEIKNTFIGNIGHIVQEAKQIVHKEENPETENSLLKTENSRLKMEISLLKTEIATLLKTEITSLLKIEITSLLRTENAPLRQSNDELEH